MTGHSRECVNISAMSTYCIFPGVSRLYYMSGSRQIPVFEKISFSKASKRLFGYRKIITCSHTLNIYVSLFMLFVCQKQHATI
jgi:hypothetical protein